MVTPAPINQAILNVAINYDFYYSYQYPLVALFTAPWSVEDCHVVARKTECGWDLEILADKQLAARFEGTVTLHDGKVNVTNYDTLAQKRM